MSSVDKEAQDKIAEVLEERVWLQDIDSPSEGAFIDAEAILDIASKILQALKELGYRKPPEGEQDLLLSPEQIRAIPFYKITPEEALPYELLKAQLAHASPLIRKDEREKVIKLIDDIDLPSVSDFYQEPKDMDSYVYGYNDGQEKTLDAVEQALKESPHSGSCPDG